MPSLISNRPRIRAIVTTSITLTVLCYLFLTGYSWAINFESQVATTAVIAAKINHWPMVVTFAAATWIIGPRVSNATAQISQRVWRFMFNSFFLLKQFQQSVACLVQAEKEKEKPSNRTVGGLNKLMAAWVQVFDPAVVGNDPFHGLVHLNISLKILQSLGLV